LVLEREIGALTGDRLILRDRSARRTIGGGRVIDPFPPARGRSKPDRLAVLAALEQADDGDAVAALLELAPRGLDLSRLARSRNLSPAEADALWRRIEMVKVGPPDAPYGLAEEAWQGLRREAVAALERWHADAPDDAGPGPDRLRKALPTAVPATVFEAVVLDLIDGGDMVRGGAHLHRPGHRTGKADADAALWARVEPLLEAGDLRPPRVVELAEALGMETKAVEGFLRRGARKGWVHAVAPNRFFPPEAVLGLGRMAEELAAQAAQDGFSVKAFRDRTGIGRNLAIEVLEFFDKSGFTRRTGDGRQILKPASDVFQDRSS
jgi:selenocysteine-specific elongation factor